MVIQKPRFFGTRAGCHGGLRRGAATVALGAVLVLSAGVPASSAAWQTAALSSQYSSTSVSTETLSTDSLLGGSLLQGITQDTTGLAATLTVSGKPEPVGTGSPAPADSSTAPASTAPAAPTSVPAQSPTGTSPASVTPPSYDARQATGAPVESQAPAVGPAADGGQPAEAAPPQVPSAPDGEEAGSTTQQTPLAMGYAGTRLPAIKAIESESRTALSQGSGFDGAQPVSALVWWGSALVGVGVLAAWLFLRMRQA